MVKALTKVKNSLQFKVGIYLVIALTIAVFLFTWMVVRNTREDLLQQVVSHNARLSEVLLKSTRFAMHENKPSEVNQIIADVGALEDIEKVRILSKDGRVIHSSKKDEIGSQVDLEAESDEDVLESLDVAPHLEQSWARWGVPALASERQ